MPLSLKTMEVQILGEQWNKRFRTVQVNHNSKKVRAIGSSKQITKWRIVNSCFLVSIFKIYLPNSFFCIVLSTVCKLSIVSLILHICTHCPASNNIASCWQCFCNIIYALKTWFEPVFEGKIIEKWSKLRETKNDFELAGGSSYRGQNYSKCLEETNLKPIFVRVSGRFELARVRVIERQLYSYLLLWREVFIWAIGFHPRHRKNRVGSEDVLVYYLGSKTSVHQHSNPVPRLFQDYCKRKKTKSDFDSTVEKTWWYFIWPLLVFSVPEVDTVSL